VPGQGERAAGAVVSSPDPGLARLRLRQARERLADRFPATAARDVRLSQVLDDLASALGTGPEAEPENREPDVWRRQLALDLWVVVDASQCIVLEVTTPSGRVLRRVTVTNAMALSAVLTAAQSVQRSLLAEADAARVTGRFDRLRAEGKLTEREAVEWLACRRHMARQAAADLVEALRFGRLIPSQLDGMTYDGTYWCVPAAEAEGSVPS